MFGFSRSERANLAPFVAFMGILAFGEVGAHLFGGRAFWMASAPRYWVFPLQTIVCAALLIRGWPWFQIRAPTRPVFTLAIAGLVFAVWISPQALFGYPPRLDGFDPAFFGNEWPYWVNLGLRGLRLVVVVPLMEEIFWRGFLLRYLIRERFEEVPFGTFSAFSFAVVTLGFCFEHMGSDWPAALITGALYNLVAYRTRSLGSCVLAHAVTNLLLGIYILRTGQWGFW
jgi:uncharacterized protein